MTKEELLLDRQTLKLSQDQFAEALGVSRHTYMRWESGATTKLPKDLATRITALAAGVTPAQIPRPDDIIRINAGSYPQFYDKYKSGGYRPNAKHPLGCSGDMRRDELEAYLGGKRVTAPAKPQAPQIDDDAWIRQAAAIINNRK